MKGEIAPTGRLRIGMNGNNGTLTIRNGSKRRQPPASCKRRSTRRGAKGVGLAP
jgi:hypothetical protein